MTLLDSIIKFVGSILFLVSALSLLWMAILFWRSRNGPLRQNLMYFFFALAWSWAIRSVQAYIPWQAGPYLNLMAGIPTTIMSIKLVLYLREAYRGKI